MTKRKSSTSPFLNEYDETEWLEWLDICRKMKPEITEAEFDDIWNQFAEAKEAAIIARSLQ